MPLRLFDVPEVLEVQEVPSDEVKIVPLFPTPKKILFPKVTSLRVVSLVLLSHSLRTAVISVHVVPSVDFRTVPELPTETNNGLEVVVVEVVVVEDSSFSPQEKMMKLKRSSESEMSICFTWFPNGD